MRMSVGAHTCPWANHILTAPIHSQRRSVAFTTLRARLWDFDHHRDTDAHQLARERIAAATNTQNPIGNQSPAHCELGTRTEATFHSLNQPSSVQILTAPQSWGTRPGSQVLTAMVFNKGGRTFGGF